MRKCRRSGGWTGNWDLYDTRHVVYRPQGISAPALKAGYDWAYSEFYRWSNIFTAARAHASSKHSLKHLAYSAGWKKFEPAWDFVIRLRQLAQMRPMLEAVLSPVNVAWTAQPRSHHSHPDVSQRADRHDQRAQSGAHLAQGWSPPTR